MQRAVIVPHFSTRLHLQGILDMLVLSQADGKKDLIVHALKNNFEADAYFVKVMGKWLAFYLSCGHASDKEREFHHFASSSPSWTSWNKVME